jgi:DNA-binding MarR family transcriptional regulator
VVDLRQEIQQQRPFASLAEEVVLNLIRTADWLDRAFERAVHPWGITGTQYNVLRILRGARPKGLTCSAIGPRMVTTAPDITRLLTRLKAMKLVAQKRDTHDRRVVWNQITSAGLKLLQQLDPIVDRKPRELLAMLSENEKAEMVRLLEIARASIRKHNETASDGENPSS